MTNSQGEIERGINQEISLDYEPGIGNLFSSMTDLVLKTLLHTNEEPLIFCLFQIYFPSFFMLMFLFFLSLSEEVLWDFIIYMETFFSFSKIILLPRCADQASLFTLKY